MIIWKMKLFFKAACSDGLARFEEWAGDDDVTVDQIIENHYGTVPHTTDLIWFLLRFTECPAMEIARRLFACFGAQGLPPKYRIDSLVFIDRMENYPITMLESLVYLLTEVHGDSVVVTKAHTVLAPLLKEYGQQP